VRGPEELEQASAELAWARPDALLVEPHALTVTSGGRIAARATEHRLPTMGGVRWFVDAGALGVSANRLYGFARVILQRDCIDEVNTCQPSRSVSRQEDE
jgi:hypothetical protein